MAAATEISVGAAALHQTWVVFSYLKKTKEQHLTGLTRRPLTETVLIGPLECD